MPNFTEMPSRIFKLPKDERGYPIPWFVRQLDDSIDFRVADGQKLIRAIKEKRCWVCGEPLGVNITFVVGPMCGINRTSGEPPSHQDCARWSALNCPFMNQPSMVRRECPHINNAKLVENAPGIAITRNPGVTLLWNTREYQTFPDPKGKILIHMGEPQSVEWYASGKPATRAQVLESIETGLILLEKVASQQEGGLAALEKYKERFMKYLPPEPEQPIYL